MLLPSAVHPLVECIGRRLPYLRPSVNRNLALWLWVIMVVPA